MVSNIGPGKDLARAALLRAPRTKTSIDVATIAGLPGAFLLVMTAIILGGSPEAFLDLKSILIVVGGTLGIVTAWGSHSSQLLQKEIRRRSIK